jgi:hypothetical protein
LEEKNIRCGADAGFTVCGSSGVSIAAPMPLLHTLSCKYG